MMHKYLFVLVFVVMGIHHLAGQEIELSEEELEELTDGTGDYWDPADRKLFDAFRKWGEKPIHHNRQLKDETLFIRLDDEHQRIAYLKEIGKNKRAAEVKAEADQINRSVIKQIKQAYPWDNYYFYYSKDAKALFVSEDYSVLFSDIGVPAENVDIKDFAYVLQYNTYRLTSQGKSYHLYLWDKERVYQLKGKRYSYYQRWHLFASKARELSLSKFFKALNRHL